MQPAPSLSRARTGAWLRQEGLCPRQSQAGACPHTAAPRTGSDEWTLTRTCTPGEIPRGVMVKGCIPAPVPRPLLGGGGSRRGPRGCLGLLGLAPRGRRYFTVTEAPHPTTRESNGRAHTGRSDPAESRVRCPETSPENNMATAREPTSSLPVGWAPSPIQPACPRAAGERGTRTPPSGFHSGRHLRCQPPPPPASPLPLATAATHRTKCH